MAENHPPGRSSEASEGKLLGLLRKRLQPVGDRLTGEIASTLNGALRAAGLKLEIETPASPPATPRPFVPFPPAAGIGPGPGVIRPAFTQPYPVIPPPPPPPAKQAPRGPTPVQVMAAVQNAVVGAVSMVSGTVAGVGAARDAARAASKTATGAASVATGAATVASAFFPKLAALGIGVPKAPKNRPGMRPQRRVADIIANPMGRTPPPTLAGGGPLDPSRPVKRIQRIPMVRAKSSLDLSRREKTQKPRSYADLQMRPQLGLTPHEILLKVATLALGKTLLGFLEAGARSQQKALQKVNERMSQKQIMLLGMLPAQYVVNRLPAAPDEPPTTPSARPQSDQSHQVSPNFPGSTSGAFKVRY